MMRKVMQTSKIMRTIRIRGWHFSKKTMFSPEEMSRDQMALLPDGRFANINSVSTSLSRIYTHEEFLPLLSSGLCDKNGVEIFNGDLLREPAKSEWDKTNFSCHEVFFHDGDANSDYNIGFTMGRTHYHGNVCGGYVPSFKPKTTAKMEVIGNIYENPELLK